MLESIADENGYVKPIEADTGIFIYPGYKFKCIDGLITNFHLPESTLIMLVSALAGKDYIMHAYEGSGQRKNIDFFLLEMQWLYYKTIKYIKNYLHFRKGNKNEISNNI